MEGALEDKAYQDTLRSPGIPLENYRSDPISSSLFADATSYPDFFNENLVSDNRIIKQFLNNSQSNIRIFYFQLFRMGFEMETQNDQGRNLAVSFRRLVFYPEFEILFTNESDNLRDVYNNQQFKRFFAEFFKLLSETPKVSVQQMVNTYPIIDQVMIHILRSILLNQGINEEFATYIPTETVFGEFSSIIGLSITSYGNCWKFEDSDMFCYQQNERAIYLAYILDEAPITQTSKVTEMIPINYYDTDQTLATDPIEQTTQYNQYSQSNQYNEYNQSNQYNKYDNAHNNTTPNYQLKQQDVKLTPVESVYAEPSYDYKYTDKYADPISSTNYSNPINSTNYVDPLSSTNYAGSATTTSNYTYTPSSYTADNYTNNNYSNSYNTNSYSSPYLPNTTSSGNSNNLDYGAYTSYTSAVTAPVSTYQAVQTKPKQYSTPHNSLSSYATTLLGNERKSMTLLEENVYGSHSNASSKLSNPAKQSMISEYFQFQAFTGETTVQKMKVPRSQAGKQSGIIGAPVVHYNQEEQFNSMKFGNFGGLAGTKPQEQGPSIATSTNSASKPYEYNSYSSNQYTSSPPSTNLTAESIYNNFSSIDAYLQDLRKFTSSTNALSSTQNKYKAETPNSTYTPVSYTAYNYEASNSASTNAKPETVGEYKSYNTPYTTSYPPSQPTQTTYPDYTSKYSPPVYGAGESPITTSSNNFGTSYTGSYNNYSQNQTQKKLENDYLGSKSVYNSSYSSYTSPQDYSFYSNNPYVSGNTQNTYQPSVTIPVNPQTTQSQTKNPYMKDSTSTDYLSRYGISSPSREISNPTKTTFEQAEGVKPQTKSGVFERTSASEYRPLYGYQNAPQQAEQKPSSSYDKYNYQAFINPSSSTQIKNPVYSSYSPSPSPSLTNYRTQLSNSGIYDIINKVKPQTAAVYSQSPTKPSVAHREQSQYVYSGPSVGGGYNTTSSYVFNYRT